METTTNNKNGEGDESFRIVYNLMGVRYILIAFILFLVIFITLVIAFVIVVVVTVLLFSNTPSYFVVLSL